MRCVHEASLYEKNCFITLTYRDEALPKDGSLAVREFQLFMKRLRKKFTGQRIRFFHCGEYGERFGRPHYHACLFGFDFPDKVLYKYNELGQPLFNSKIAEGLWPFGFVVIGAVTFESAAYVARYVMKKVTGAKADEHYQGRRPEYVTMSRRPGIGRGWFEKWGSDVYPSDSVVMRGREFRPPKFYDGIFEQVNPSEMARLKNRRICKALAVPFKERTLKRLAVSEKVKRAQIQTLSRKLEV